ncbi:hypothetical protein J2Y45_002196 [Dyadobacter sp. BE34]|uniref:Outer membrane protein beta-barrel domain-containing protein n=1 Tax=Dyadobacter fermentans TaxID=94254 RepID=A0ABU1QYX5_9BACT|nr:MULTISPECIES: hypothetical protein [Dyadobacter]MDR6805495.1 hypothetical protein [Dyadobacter fermentans]MDR7042745.1 hypothetical protein [Dyadobacter sp. BE242]MDR7197057.1 hypothetical protein [Dyadobacter sp. BE34]MDR7215508.1 hypothetical protein [Dyadobacter sp. BE31]MDR7263044.1 hypothetical protein [Dyadobacter sp. BE32]
MKSSDERIDEELRKALRERFDNFERLPDPTLREKIFQGLGGGTSMVQTGLVASLLLLIALTATVYLVSYSVEKKREVVAGIKQVRRELSNVLPASSKSPARQEDRQEPETVATHQVASQPALPIESNTVSKAGESVQAGTLRATRIVAHSYKYKRADVVKWVEAARSKGFASIWVGDKDISPADRAFLESEMAKADFGNGMPDSTVTGEGDIKELEGPSLADQDIGVLDHRPMALPKYNWEPDSLVTPGKPQKRYEFLFKEHWSFIAGLTPLRTFQILTVRPGNGVVYQNFVLPAKISAQTVGYKVSAGVERSGFQLLVNYGQFKQSYRYEIATSEFAVGPDLTGNYEVVRKGIPQEENSTVRLVGMAVKKHTVRRSHFLRNYFGDFGAEFSRDLTSGKNMAWVNAGFGKELFAGNNVVMTVGPYFEYSLSKLRNPDNPFKIQPYQIGLSVGLRYTRK